MGIVGSNAAHGNNTLVTSQIHDYFDIWLQIILSS